MLNFLSKWLNSQGLEIVTQPLSKQVVGMQDDYALTEGLSKLGWRVIRRKLYLFFSGQMGLMQEKADPQWKRGLWIYFRTAQIGDSLMDLAARDLFTHLGCKVDLLTNEKLKELYEGDEWFDSVTADAKSLNPQNYDFIIVQSVHHRALKTKVEFFKSKPWLCMQGYFDVPDFARASWSAQRLLDFWSYTQPIDIALLGTQKLSADRLVAIEKKSIDITIVLGGIDPVRTYPYWEQVLLSTNTIKKKEISLIGMGTVAEQCAKEIVKGSSNFLIHNRVNQLSLSECIKVLANTKVLLVADGGAMHLGVAVQVPHMIALFIKEIPPSLRIPSKYHGQSIVSKTGFIRDIAVEDVCHQLELVLTDQLL